MKKQDYEQLGLFQVDSHASHFPLQENEGGYWTSVISGRKCSELSTNSGQLGSLVRTLLGSSLWRSRMRKLEWRAEQLTEYRDTIYLKRYTHATSECCSRTSSEVLRKSDTKSRHLLFRLAVLEPGISDTGSRLLPTPAARDSKGKNSPEHVANGSHMNQLANFVIYATPTAGISHGTTGGGNRRDLRNDVGGQLNPDWVEWLMGFPIGWTDTGTQSRKEFRA